MVQPFVLSQSHLGAHRPSARWIVSLFAASILLQRFALPGGTVPLLLVVTLAACTYGLHTGVLEFDRFRLNLYLLAAALTAAVAIPQSLLLTRPMVSLTSWGLFMIVWAPAVLRLRHRDRATLHAAFRGCLHWGVALAAVATLMRVVQMAGVPYVDPLPNVFPQSLLVQGYVITYPIEYGSDIYRSNAWIGLEPSIISLQIGITLLLGVLLRARAVILIVIAVGMLSTGSGSGIFVAAIGLFVMLVTPMRRQLWRYFAAGALTILVMLQTPVGRGLASRATEAAIAGSSTNLRAIEPYEYLWPIWTDNVWNVVVGLGAGSSQRLVEATGRAGLLVPSPVKVFFDYGIVAGLSLAIFLIYCYYRSPSLALALSLFTSSWVLQPGTTTFVLVVQTMIFVTWWAPRGQGRIEFEPFTKHESYSHQVEVKS